MFLIWKRSGERDLGPIHAGLPHLVDCAVDSPHRFAEPADQGFLTARGGVHAGLGVGRA